MTAYNREYTFCKNCLEKWQTNGSKSQQSNFNSPWRARELDSQNYHNRILVLSSSKLKITNLQEIGKYSPFTGKKKSDRNDPCGNPDIGIMS